MLGNLLNGLQTDIEVSTTVYCFQLNAFDIFVSRQALVSLTTPWTKSGAKASAPQIFALKNSRCKREQELLYL